MKKKTTILMTAGIIPPGIGLSRLVNGCSVSGEIANGAREVLF